MIEFTVPDMSCGHCVAAITRSAKAVDPAADVQVDLASRRVRIRSDRPRDGFAAALAEAGYAPAATPAVNGPAGPRSPTRPSVPS